MMKRKNGFTLLELLIVVGLMGILMALLLPALIKVKDTGSEKRIEVNAKAILVGVNIYKQRYHKWPADTDDLENGVDVYYGSRSDPHELYESEGNAVQGNNKIKWANNNSVIFNRLVRPPDGSGSDAPCIDLSDFIVDGNGNVLMRPGEDEEQYRITFDLDGNYTPSGGTAVGLYRFERVLDDGRWMTVDHYSKQKKYDGNNYWQGLDDDEKALCICN